MDNDLFDGILDAIAGKVPVNANGLKHCQNCGGALETEVEFNGVRKVVPCICKCEQQRRENEAREINARERRENTRRVCFHGDILQHCTFENDNGNNAKVTTALKKYVDNFDILSENGHGLLLYGNIGTGKTYGAACVANALIDRDYTAYMSNFARIINKLQESFEGRNKKLDKLNEYDLLIIDDLAAERQTDYVNEIIYTVIDSRYRSNKPMIITTNLTIDELKKPTNIATARIYSRILEKCFPIEVNGVNQRRAKIADEYNDVKNILGL